MTVIIQDDFELGLSKWGIVRDAAIVDSPVHSGVNAVRVTAPLGVNAGLVYYPTTGMPPTVSVRASFCLPALPLPGHTLELIGTWDLTYRVLAGVVVSSTGATSWSLRTPSGKYLFNASISPNVYYDLEIIRTDGAGTGSAVLYVDNVPVLSRTGETITPVETITLGVVWTSDTTSTSIVYLDDVVVSDTGTVAKPNLTVKTMLDSTTVLPNVPVYIGGVWVGNTDATGTLVISLDVGEYLVGVEPEVST